jgi:NitT/TauT family transport system ATP-binding protein
MARSSHLAVVDTAPEESADSSGPAAGTEIVLTGARKTVRRGTLETHALDGVDLTIRAGEFVAIVGPSGCGKSTLMRLVSGLLPPSEGQVTIGGHVVSGPQTDLGIVFQKPILLDWRTVLDNVLLQTEMRSMGKAEHVDRARSLLAAVGLTDFEERYPHELSGGMQQRVAIVRALIHNPPLLLMDEPFGALDALTREQMRIDLEELWLAGKKTVLFITHSIDEAVLLADRVVVMSPRPGSVEQIIDIELERPRGLNARKLAAFDDAVEAITGIFLARGVLRSSAELPSLLAAQQG